MTRTEDDISRAGHELMAILRANPNSFSGQSCNDLLSLFFRGFAIENLRAILQNPNDRAVIGGLFIAEELGARAIPILPELLVHLKHVDPKVRSAAYVAVASCTCREDREEFAFVVLGIRDPDPQCRKVVMFWMARVGKPTLKEALKSLEKSPTNLELQSPLELIADEQEPMVSKIQCMLSDPDPLTRRFGLIAAMRSVDRHPELLKLAAQSEDVEIRSAAELEVNLKSRLEKLKRIR